MITKTSLKPKNPYPSTIRRILKRILPPKVYRRHIGRHEDESLHRWIHLASLIKPSESILDIGAHIGEYAIAARNVNENCKIIAFEPNPHSAEKLHQNCLGLGITLERIAVAEEEGFVSFVIASAMSQIIKSERAWSGEKIVVPATSLDSYTNQKNIHPALIKIDTEGAEGGILRGAASLLKQYSPVILCEVLTDQAGIEVMDALPNNYMFYYIDENKGYEEREKITRDTWRNHNWLLIPSTKRSMLKS